jgi:DNA-binding MarR family transcriptional regulator
MTTETTQTPKRLSLLYQVWLLEVSTTRFKRVALSGTGVRGEEYGLLSYLYANSQRTLTQAAKDLGQPLTTLATLLAPLIANGDVVRRPHPRDRRARLLELSPEGRARLGQVIPHFSAAYTALLHELEARGADIEAMYAHLDELRSSIERTIELMELEQAGADSAVAGADGTIDVPARPE